MNPFFLKQYRLSFMKHALCESITVTPLTMALATWTRVDAAASADIYGAVLNAMTLKSEFQALNLV